VSLQDVNDCIVVPSIPTDEVRSRFPKEITEIKPYLRMTDPT
jgi:GTP-binding protein HflX